jgi:Ca-activated chloride channel homolog
MAHSRYQNQHHHESNSLVTISGLILLVICFMIAAVVSSATKGNASQSARAASGAINVSIIASPETQAVLSGMVDKFNKTKPQIDRRTVKVSIKFMESGEMLDAVLSGQEKPIALSPASSTWLAQLNAGWQAQNSGGLPIASNAQQLFVTPIVVGMWESMARAMGYPNQILGWSEIIKGTLDPKGWGAFGHGEWGAFRFAHASPDTDSGRLAILAEFYAGAGKVRGLSQADLQSQSVRDYVSNIERGVVQYGESAAALVDLMRQKGQTALSAAVMEEQALIQFNQGKPQQRLIAIYPKEGTFWADHPYVALNADWVSNEQRQAANLFLQYVLAPEQQRTVLAAGFRPANLDVGLDNSAISAANGADPQQPKTLLAVPDPSILALARNAWTLTKKQANIYLVADVSGSMAGDKIEKARQGLLAFVGSVADSDQIGLYKFSTNVQRPVPLAKLNATQRQRLQDEIQNMVAGGNTALYQVAHDAVAELVRLNDKNSINAVVLMTDGKETVGQSKSQLISYLTQVQRDGDRTGVQVKLFCIAYGSDADLKVLGDMSDATLGKALPGTPENINKLYKLLSTYF